MNDIAVVTVKGVRRWESGHPWIYRSDVAERPGVAAGVVQVQDNRKRRLGWALWSPKSEISLRLLDSDPDATIDAAWWQGRIQEAFTRRVGLDAVTNAYRVVHGEGDALRFGRMGKMLIPQPAAPTQADDGKNACGSAGEMARLLADSRRQRRHPVRPRPGERDIAEGRA